MSSERPVVNSIKDDVLDNNELLQHLDNKSLLVRASAIMNIMRRKVNSTPLIEKLGHIARHDKHDRVVGTLTCARLAAAALHSIESDESKQEYKSIRKNLPQDEQTELDLLIQTDPTKWM